MRLPRSLVVLIAGVAALLIAGIAVAIVASRQPETAFPADSPAGTVATYLRLLQDGAVDDAYALTAFPVAAGGSPGPGSRDQFHQEMDRWSSQLHRVTLLRATENGDRASVIVEITAYSPDAFASSDRTLRQTFTLERRDGAWKITGPVYLYV